MLIRTKHAGYGADGTRTPFKGGGGGPKYDNLDKLYAVQAKQAEQLMGISNEIVYPAMRQLSSEARGYGSQANREKAAASSAAEVAAARQQSQQQLLDTMGSYGTNPADMGRAVAKNSATFALADAAGRTAARDRVDDTGFARLKDVTSMGMGVPSAATEALGAAGRTATGTASMAAQQSAQQSADIAGAVQGGINTYGYGAQNKMWGGADGGYVDRELGIGRAPLRLAEGGYVHRFARGGLVPGGGRGLLSPGADVPLPPSSPVQGPSTANQGASMAGPLLMKPGTPETLGRGIQAVGQGTGNAATVQAGNNLAMAGSDPAAMQFANSADTLAYQMAEKQVAGELGTTATTAAPVAEAAGAAATGAEAAGAAATGAEVASAAAPVAAEAAGAAGVAGGLGAAGGAAMAALGTAMPWVGAAMLAGSALGLFADGGEVGGEAINANDNGTGGGEVDGAGGPKDDLIPAMLSDGEYVMPVGVVKKFGLDRLEKMRHEGLQFERQLGIGRPQ